MNGTSVHRLCLLITLFSWVPCDGVKVVDFRVSVNTEYTELYIDGRMIDNAFLKNRNVPDYGDHFPVAFDFILAAVRCAFVPRSRFKSPALIVVAGNFVSDTQHWKCIHFGSVPSDWMKPSVGDLNWPAAVRVANPFGIVINESWIWSADGLNKVELACRGSPYNISCLYVPDNCLNGGTKQFSVASQDCYCACLPGFLGELCQKNLTCVHNDWQCLNGGTVRYDYTKGTCFCSCDENHGGAHCEVEGICLNNGTAVYDNFKDSSYCSCVPGFDGYNCEFTIKCLNGGKLVNRVCQCSGMYVGKYCECNHGGFIAAIVILIGFISLLIAGIIVESVYLYRYEQMHPDDNKKSKIFRKNKVAPATPATTAAAAAVQMVKSQETRHPSTSTSKADATVISSNAKPTAKK